MIDNPYCLLTTTIFNDILVERDLNLGRGSIVEQAQRMNEVDEILPDWKNEIANVPLLDLPNLSLPKIYFYGALHGISAEPFSRENISQPVLGHTIAALTLCRNNIRPAPPENSPREPLKTQKIAVQNLEHLLTIVAAQGESKVIPQFQNTPSILFGIDNNQLNEVVTKLAEYPITIPAEHYDILRHLRPRSLARAVEYRGVPRVMTLLMSREENIFALSRGRMPHVSSDCSRYYERWRLIVSLPSDNRNILMNIYNADFNGS